MNSSWAKVAASRATANETPTTKTVKYTPQTFEKLITARVPAERSRLLVLLRVCNDEDLRRRAYDVFNEFRKTNIEVPFLWALLACAAKDDRMPWCQSKGMVGNPCVFYNYGPSTGVRCTKAGHEIFHRCLLCNGSHPLVGYSLGSRIEGSCCSRWVQIEEEFEDLLSNGLKNTVLKEDLANKIFRVKALSDPGKNSFIEIVHQVSNSQPPRPLSARNAKQQLPAAAPTLEERVENLAVLNSSPEEPKKVTEIRKAEFAYIRDDQCKKKLAHKLICLPDPPGNAQQPYLIFCTCSGCHISHEKTDSRHNVYYGHFYMNQTYDCSWQPVAVKTISVDLFRMDGDPVLNPQKLFEREVQAIQKLQPHLLLFFKFDVTLPERTTFHVLATKHCTNNLTNYLMQKPERGSEDERPSSPISGEDIPFSVRLELMRQTFKAVHLVHKKGFIHGDVKPMNVLVNETTDCSSAGIDHDDKINVELCDFEFSRFNKYVPSPASTVGATPLWSSPEQTYNHATSVYSDMWSLGLVLYDIVYRVIDRQNSRGVRGDSEVIPMFWSHYFPQKSDGDLRRVCTNLTSSNAFALQKPDPCPKLLWSLICPMLDCTPENRVTCDRQQYHLLLQSPTIIAQFVTKTSEAGDWNHGSLDHTFKLGLSRKGSKKYFEGLDEAIIKNLNDNFNRTKLEILEEEGRNEEPVYIEVYGRNKSIASWRAFRQVRNLLAHPTSSPAALVEKLLFELDELFVDVVETLASLQLCVHHHTGELRTCTQPPHEQQELPVAPPAAAAAAAASIQTGGKGSKKKGKKK